MNLFQDGQEKPKAGFVAGLLKCIIFDMDGTLTKTNQLIYDSFNYVAEKYIHKRLTQKEIVALFGPPEREAVENMIGSEHITEAMEDYYRFYTEHHNELASLFPGIIGILELLKSREIIIALFTGKGRMTTDITLRQFAISKYFDMVVTGDDVDEFKPSGEGISKIMEKFSLQPFEVLMVGDAVADVKASQTTGVAIAAVVWDSYGKDSVLKMKTDYVFHDVPEFQRWLTQSLA